MLITLAETPERESNEFATVLKVAPDGIVIALVVLALFIPNVAAACPNVTEPPTTVASGTTFVTVLKTLVPDVVFPNVWMPFHLLMRVCGALVHLP